MKKLLGILGLFLFFMSASYADKNTEKAKEFIKSISQKSLTKDQTKKFLHNYAITLKDERGDGIVTYIFEEKSYKRYKDFKIITEGAWRFTNTGALRVFNNDVKLTWKIKIKNKNNINIRAKYDPIGKLYEFSYEPKEDYLERVKQYEQEKLDAQKKAEEEKLDAQKKAEEEKKRLEQEKLDAQKKAEEEKKRLEQEKLDAQKKAEEEKKRLEEEKLLLQKEIEEQKKKLEQEKLDAQKKAEEEKLDAQKKAEEENKRLEQEKLDAKKKAEEEKKRLEEEKSLLQKEIEEQKKKLEQEKLYNQLKPKYGRKCKKNFMNKLYEVGSPEYRTCVINKGPEKQLQKKAEEEKKRLEQEKLDAQKKAEEEKKRLEQEKLDAQKKAEEEKKRLEQEKLDAQKKAEEEKKRLEQEKLDAQKKAEEEKLATKFRSVISDKWSIGNMDCKTNGGTYIKFSNTNGEIFVAGGKPQTGEGLSIFEGSIKKISDTKFIVTQIVYPTPSNKLIYGAIGKRYTAKIIKHYKIINENQLSYENDVEMIDVDAILNGNTGNQVGYNSRKENGKRNRCN